MMNIGIIVHSQTGTTLEFGKIIEKALSESGNSVDVIRVETNVPVNFGSVRQPKKFSIVNIPDCKKYDVLLVGGPVWAFSASPVIAALLQELQDISGKKLLPFVTMGFPFPFMGGKQAIALMSGIASGKGAEVLPGRIIPKLFHDFKKHMEEAASEIQTFLEA